MKIYQFLANCIACFHWIWASMLVVGIFLSIYHPTYRICHAIIISSTLVGQVTFPSCPLTMLENSFRRRYDPKTVYTGSFAVHYFESWIGITIHPKWITLTIGAVILYSLYVFIFSNKGGSI